jgi:glutaconyl-CoA/methylmalonyl-CoA decarboxylase subunit gamma
MPLSEIDRHRILLTAAASAVRGNPSPTRLRIRLDGVSYDVEVEVLTDLSSGGEAEEPVDLPESVLQPPLPAYLRDEDRYCRCPIAGSIVAVSAVAGNYLKKDDPVAVIEAMKMQTTIGAPVDGLIEEVCIAPGQSVKPGQVLCRQSA